MQWLLVLFCQSHIKALKLLEFLRILSLRCNYFLFGSLLAPALLQSYQTQLMHFSWHSSQIQLPFRKMSWGVFRSSRGNNTPKPHADQHTLGLELMLLENKECSGLPNWWDWFSLGEKTFVKEVRAVTPGTDESHLTHQTFVCLSVL